MRASSTTSNRRFASSSSTTRKTRRPSTRLYSSSEIGRLSRVRPPLPRRRRALGLLAAPRLPARRLRDRLLQTRRIPPAPLLPALQSRPLRARRPIPRRRPARMLRQAHTAPGATAIRTGGKKRGTRADRRTPSPTAGGPSTRSWPRPVWMHARWRSRACSQPPRDGSRFGAGKPPSAVVRERIHPRALSPTHSCLDNSLRMG